MLKNILKTQNVKYVEL